MAKNFKILREKMSPEARERSHAKAQKMMEEMALDELREANELTQEQLASVLGVKQATVSKMERRTDMYLSTLRGIIKAMGGNLEIRAVFPSGSVVINQFRKLRQRTRR